jgi:type II secretory pathway predicted ATPase ExeA
MYQRQFGLEQNPFGTAANGDQVYTGTKGDKAVANLKIGLSKTDAVVALVGPAGVGKSTLALRAVEAASQQALTAVVAHLPLSGDELLEMLIAEFGINSEANTTMARFQDLRCFFAEQAQEDCRLYILVEDAAVLGTDNLNLLTALTAADPRGYTGANLILMGDEGLLDLLNTEVLTRLQQRVRAQQSLAPFTAVETTEYIAHRIASAGGEPQEFLDGNVGLAVFQSTQGIARVIDNLMDTALCFAFSRKQGSLLPAMVQKVARSIYGLPTDPPIEPASPVAVNESPEIETAAEAPPSSQPVANSITSETASPEPAVEEAATPPSFENTGEAPVEEPPAKPEVIEPVENTTLETADVSTTQPAPAAESTPHSEPAVESAPPPASDNVEAIPVESLKDLADVETAVAATAYTKVAQTTAATSFEAPRPELAEVAPQPNTDTSENTSGSEPSQDDVVATPQEEPAAEAPAANSIPVLEDAIELALIAEALAAGPMVPKAESAALAPQQASPSEAATIPAGNEDSKTEDGAFEDWAANVAQAASLEELDAQIAETLFGSPDLKSLSAQISSERQAAKPIEERGSESEGIVPNNVAGGGLG